MMRRFHGPLGKELEGFLQFKRQAGYGYSRGAFTLAEFDRFLARYVGEHATWRFDEAVLAWLASKPHRKAVSVSADAAVLRQFCRYVRRLSPQPWFSEPRWPQLPTTSAYVPSILSTEAVRRLLDHAARLTRPSFRAPLYRALILVLYCTGIRFGEALRLRVRDVDCRAGVLFVREFKGRARWVPFHASLLPELRRYLAVRQAFAPGGPDERFFVGINRQQLPASTAWHTFDKLFGSTGLKLTAGRGGPRPYDLRHTFAVHRLTRWYRAGVDLHTRLPWLSAYMGHADILGTETYLTSTPLLLKLARDRFRRRYLAEAGTGRAQ